MRLLTCLLLLLPTALIAQPVAIAIHGGAGNIQPFDEPGQERLYNAALAQAARAGHEVLTAGGTALDAVQTAVQMLEDNPMFNAGRGSVFNHEGVNELDAAIMDGATANAGAVAGLKHVRNPILLARAVMDHSPHVLLMGEGAEVFARERGLEFVDPEFFHTPRRWQQLQNALERERKAAESTSSTPLRPRDDELFSTVGAVALDRQGNLAAATSTGGRTNKRFGRVGDVPIIGAGTYANNATCAISATGHGEYFIRNVVAYDICARMEYKGESLAAAAEAVVMDKLVQQEAGGGVIGVDGKGNLAMQFNTTGMYRASIDTEGNLTVGIFK